jgi:uncharacterized protein (TIRG00374 family)
VVALALLWRLESVRRIARQIRDSFLSVWVVAILTVVSSAIIFLGFVGVALLGTGLGLDIDPLFFVAAMPLVAFVSSLPITVGGWGVREGMMVLGLGVFGVKAESALALSVVYGIAGVLVSCFFGAIALLLWYMMIWRTQGKPQASADDG